MFSSPPFKINCLLFRTSFALLRFYLNCCLWASSIQEVKIMGERIKKAVVLETGHFSDDGHSFLSLCSFEALTLDEALSNKPPIKRYCCFFSGRIVNNKSWKSLDLIGMVASSEHIL